jgi:thioredoxin-related protein
MKTLLVTLACLATMSFVTWQPDFEAAKQTASQKHALILLNFSGSDWCGPCMRMRKEIFDNPTFTKMADTTLVLVNADFPRNKKNQPDNATKKQNEALADLYNASGRFPFTVLLDEKGTVLKSWDGLPKEDAAAFALQIKQQYDARR